MRPENRKPTRQIGTLAAALMLTTALGTAFGVSAHAAASAPGWTPQSSEKLVKLPPGYLKKSLDHDFAGSALGAALRGADEEIGYKTRTLTDLKGAVSKATGETQVEIRHQLLAEKRAFIELMSGRNGMRRSHLTTKLRVLEQTLERAGRNGEAATPAMKALVDKQDAAKQRFESSLSRVDMKLFGGSSMPESKYSARYASNMDAIEKLVDRIRSHRMADEGIAEGIAKTRSGQLRQMIQETQAEIAILEQEETILGYMAKLVALDAMELSETTLDAELADSDLPGTKSPAKSVDLFLSN